MRRNIFITGATGNIGSGLAAKILSDYPSDKVILLIRADSENHAHERFRQTIEALYPDFDIRSLNHRIEIVKGDITRKHLGLSDQQYHYLTYEISHIIHSAACTKFDLDLNLALKTNFVGTKNVVRLAHDIKKRGRAIKLAHISTAFVCGNREGTIYEDDLDESADCANSYEYTKMIAELYVRRHTHEIPAMIFRPSIVVGDSYSGRIARFNVLYTPLKYICMRLINGLPCDPDTPLDIVPLDFVCKSIARIFLNTKACVPQTFHVAAGRNNCPTIGEIVRKTIFLYAAYLPYKRMPYVEYYSEETDPALNIHPIRIRHIINSYRPYIGYNRIFDTADFENALSSVNLQLPNYHSYLTTILTHFIQTALARNRVSAAGSEMI
jgi:thioester reductase-like protein